MVSEMLMELSRTSIELRTVFCSPWENVNLYRSLTESIENGKPIPMDDHQLSIVSDSFDDSCTRLSNKVMDQTSMREGADKVIGLLGPKNVKPFLEMMVEADALLDDEMKLARDGVDLIRCSNTMLHDTGRILHLLTAYALERDQAQFMEFAQEIFNALVDEGFVADEANLLQQFARLSLDLRGSLRYRDTASHAELLYQARRIRRVVEIIFSMYASNLVGIPEPNRPPLVMKLQSGDKFSEIAGLSMWTHSMERERMAQSIELTNILSRMTFRVVGDRHIGVICKPAKIIHFGNDVRGLPLPRYAIATVEFRSLNKFDDLYLYNGLVTQKGLPVRQDGSRDNEAIQYRLALSSGLMSSDRELDTRFLLIAGEHVPDELLNEYVCDNLVASRKYFIQAVEAIVFAEDRPSIAEETLESIRRVKELMQDYELPHDVEEGDDEVIVVEHADMDDSVSKLRGIVKIDSGITLSRPKGKEWKERVHEKWQGEIDGQWMRLKLDKSTGQLDSAGRWLPMLSSANKFGEIGINIGPVKIKCGVNCPGNNHNLSKTLSLLSSKVPSSVARMALYAIEMQGVHTDRNGACYMPRDGDGPKVNHISAIPVETFSGVDVYYRQKDKAVFVMTMRRSLRLKKHPTEPKMYQVTESSFDKRHCLLAHIKLSKGRCG